jgi:hypothetical protein
MLFRLYLLRVFFANLLLAWRVGMNSGQLGSVEQLEKKN